MQYWSKHEIYWTLAIWEVFFVGLLLYSIRPKVLKYKLYFWRSPRLSLWPTPLYVDVCPFVHVLVFVFVFVFEVVFSKTLPFAGICPCGEPPCPISWTPCHRSLKWSWMFSDKMNIVWSEEKAKLSLGLATWLLVSEHLYLSAAPSSLSLGRCCAFTYTSFLI